MKKGFTLIELLVVLVIIGVFLMFISPNIRTFIEQGKSQTAKNNLLAISAAQQKYYEENSAYCYGICGSSLANLNANLQLGAPLNDSFNYVCSNPPAPYRCVATNGSVTLTMTVSSGVSINCTGGINNSYCPP